MICTFQIKSKSGATMSRQRQPPHPRQQPTNKSEEAESKEAEENSDPEADHAAPAGDGPTEAIDMEDGAAQGYRFRPLTPPNTDEIYDCAFCTKSYAWLKSYKRHVTDSHEGGKVAEDLQERADRVHCRTCYPNKTISRHLLGRHLKTVHDLAPDNPNEKIRGFRGNDDDPSWGPVYLRRGVPDPP